jgi:hypothetical protein
LKSKRLKYQIMNSSIYLVNCHQAPWMKSD